MKVQELNYFLFFFYNNLMNADVHMVSPHSKACVLGVFYFWLFKFHIKGGYLIAMGGHVTKLLGSKPAPCCKATTSFPSYEAFQLLNDVAKD